MLKLEEKKLHTVKAGQTLRSISRAYQIPESVVVLENGLTGEPYAGQVLILPKKRGDYYIIPTRYGEETGIQLFFSKIEINL